MSIALRKIGEKLIRRDIEKLMEKKEKEFYAIIPIARKKAYEKHGIFEKAKKVFDLNKAAEKAEKDFCHLLGAGTYINDNVLEELANKKTPRDEIGDDIERLAIKEVGLLSPHEERERLINLQDKLIKEVWTKTMPEDINALLEKIK